MASEASWDQSAQQFQQFFADQWAKSVAAFPTAPAGAAGPAAVQLDAAKLQELQQHYVREATALWSQGVAQPSALKDKRFGAAAWAA